MSFKTLLTLYSEADRAGLQDAQQVLRLGALFGGRRRSAAAAGEERCGKGGVLDALFAFECYYNQHKLGKPQILCLRALFITVFQGI